MKYTTRPGEDPGEAHVNYECPCGCIAGLIYERKSGARHLGQCCCGRLLWLGPDAGPVVERNFDATLTYEVELDRVTLPWGDEVLAALAVPVGLSSEARARFDQARAQYEEEQE